MFEWSNVAEFSKDFLGCSARLFDPRGVRGQRDTDGADLFFSMGLMMFPDV